MGQTVGQVDLDLVLQSQQFKTQLNGAVRSAMSGVQTQTKGLAGAFGKIGALVGAAFAIKQVVKFGAECTALGSNLTEVQNVVDVTFRTMSDQVNKFAESAIGAYGLSETVAKKYTGTFGAMAKAFGFSESSALEMSTTLTGLAGDVASFYNLSSDEAYTKLKSVFTGETESLKELGVVMTQSALDEFALQKGIGKTTSAMTEQEKTALRYQFVLAKLNDASGDFSRTSGSWANQTRVLSLRFDALKASIGQGLINVLTPVVRWLNIILERLNVVAKAFAAFTGGLSGQKAQSGAGAIAGELSDAAGAAQDTAAGIAAAGSAAKKARSMMGFDELNALTDTSGGSAGGSSAADLKTAADAAAGVAESAAKTKTYVDQIADAFKQGFQISFDTGNLSGLKQNITNLKKNLSEIFTDPAVDGAVKRFGLKVAKAFGQSVGGIGSIGVSMGNAMIGGANLAIENNGSNLKRSLTNIFNISGNLAQLSGDLTTAIVKVFSAIGSKAGQAMTGGIMGSFGAVILGKVEVFAATMETAFTLMFKPLIDNADKIRQVFENVFAIVAPFFEGIAEGIGAFYTDLSKFYNDVIKPMTDTVAGFFSGVLGPILDWVNSILGPLGEHASLLQTIGKILGYVIGAISGILAILAVTLNGALALVIGASAALFGHLGQVKTFVVAIWTGIKDALFTIVTGAATAIQTTFTGLHAAIGAIFGGILTTVATVWGLIKTTIGAAVSGIVSGVTGAFIGMKTGITNVLNEVKTVFSSVFDALVGVVKTPINAIISALNALIDGLNGVSITVPSWVPKLGGKSFGFSVPHIPALANGGYVAANTPQLAMIGDNKHEGEIVAPESKIAEAVAAAMQNVMSQLAVLMAANRGGQLATTDGQPINIYLGDELLDSIIVSSQNRRNLRSGGRG